MPKEISFEMPDDMDINSFRSEVSEALLEESGVLWITDVKGREVGIPGSRIGYVEIGVQESDRPVGFS
tara:strand:+ start:1269 stop:1472 length:204 start_codon:yes stop_codon:yes gene_type:complete